MQLFYFSNMEVANYLPCIMDTYIVFYEDGTGFYKSGCEKDKIAISWDKEMRTVDLGRSELTEIVSMDKELLVLQDIDEKGEPDIHEYKRKK